MIERSLFASAGRIAKLDALGFFSGDVVGDAVTFQAEVIEHFALKDQHRKTVINPLARKLSQHGLLDQFRTFVR